MAVTLHTRNTKLGNAVELAVSPTDVEATVAPVVRADAVVTTGQLTSSAQWFASRLGTSYVCVLPEAAEWLQSRVAEGRITTLAGPDMAVPKPK